MDCDVLIVGAGVVGCAVARELSRYRLDVVTVERSGDVASGASRANSGIVHAGYDCAPGTRMARLGVAGSRMMEALCAQLSVPYRRVGSMVIALDAAQREILRRLMEQGERNGVPGMALLTGKEALRREPALNPAVSAALWAPTAAVVCPYELTLALAENAVANGAALRTGWEPAAIEKKGNGLRAAGVNGERITARYIVNAAGTHAGAVSAMAGGIPLRVVPRRGEYLVLDRSEGNTVRSVIFQPPSAMGKGVLVTATVHGNLLAGPTARDTGDGDDSATTAEGLEEARASALRSVPGIRFDRVIRAFSGVRAVLADRRDFMIEADPRVRGLVHAAGICSPGLSSAPAVAGEIAGILAARGLPMAPKKDFRPERVRPKAFRDMDEGERKAAVAADPRYGRVVCRCETVTEAEIAAAVHGVLPANTLDAVKWRTRAGMGRCQSGFCMPRVMEILARERGAAMDRITKSGGESWLVCPRNGAGEERP